MSCPHLGRWQLQRHGEDLVARQVVCLDCLEVLFRAE